MDQMQTTMLYMLQTVTATQTVKASSETESSEFQSMLEKQQKLSEQPKDAEQVDAKAELSEKEEPLDEVALQELAAMQMFVADTVQIVNVEAEEVSGVENVVFTAEAAEQVQTVLGGEEANPVAEVAVEQIGAEQMAQTESKAERPAVETTEVSVEATEQSELTVKTAEGTEQKQSETNTNAETDHSEDYSEQDVQVSGETVERVVFREVETAPVKVSDVAAEAEDVTVQISDKLTETLAKGETRVELQLTPDHLGKITIELTRSSDGALHVSLFAENNQTRLMLERDMGGLQSALNQTVRQDVQVEVSQQQEEQSYDGHNQQQSNREQEQQQRKHSGEDFLNQLRLGLIPLDEAAS